MTIPTSLPRICEWYEPEGDSGLVSNDMHTARNGYRFFVPTEGGGAVGAWVCPEHGDMLQARYDALKARS